VRYIPPILGYKFASDAINMHFSGPWELNCFGGGRGARRHMLYFVPFLPMLMGKYLLQLLLKNPTLPEIPFSHYVYLFCHLMKWRPILSHNFFIILLFLKIMCFEVERNHQSGKLNL
jgi:hypothetical protein